jgi:hypothetical protein
MASGCGGGGSGLAGEAGAGFSCAAGGGAAFCFRKLSCSRMFCLLASSHFVCDDSYPPQNAADLGPDSELFSKNKPDQWISWDFKALRIKPKHDTV